MIAAPFVDCYELTSVLMISIYFYFLVCSFLLLAWPVQLQQLSHPLLLHRSQYGLNANRMVQPIKINHFNAVICTRRPHIFIVNETKTKSKLRSSLPFLHYDIYEEPGECAKGHHIFKWDVVVGIRKDLQVAQRLEIKQKALKGHVVALDIVLPTPNDRCFKHCFFGAYTPWNLGSIGDVSLFWRDMTSLCQSTTSLWTMAGDFNATVASFECLSSGADARDQYLRFLIEMDGHDLWSDVEEHSCLNDWTCRSS